MVRSYCHQPEVLVIGARGFSILVDGMPVFVAFSDHPAFAGIPREELRQIQRPRSGLLLWPNAGITIALCDLRPKTGPEASSLAPPEYSGHYESGPMP